MSDQQHDDELHTVSDCIQVGMRLDGVDDLVETGAASKMSQCAQTILKFFQHHQKIVKQHAEMYAALQAIAEHLTRLPVADAMEDASQKVLRALWTAAPMKPRRRVHHLQQNIRGMLVAIEYGRPVVWWDNQDGSTRLESWDLIGEVSEQ